MTGTLSRAARAALVALIASTALMTSASPASAAPCGYGTPSGDYCYDDIGGAASIVGYTGVDTILTIPAMLDGLPVTTIGYGAFMSCSLTSVTLPDSVTTIDGQAFYACALDSLDLGNGVTSIGLMAFAHNFLTSVDLPASVTTVGDIAFDFNPLALVRIAGDEPASIGLDVFGDPEHGTDPIVTFHSGATYSSGAPFAPGTWMANSTFYRVQEESTVTFSAAHGVAPEPVDVITLNELAGISDGEVADPGDPFETGWRFDGWFDAPTGGNLVGFPLTVTADATLYAHWTATPCGSATRSGDFCYAESGGHATITDYLGAGGDLVIPGTLDGFPVTTIGYIAFLSNGLTSINLPESVTWIDVAAFQNNDLTTVLLTDSVTHIGDSAFLGNDISILRIGDSVTTIEGWAFYTNSLDDVTIPASVEDIGELAFGDNPVTAVRMDGDEPSTMAADVFGPVSGLHDPLVTFRSGAAYTTITPGYWRAGPTDYRVQELSSLTWVTAHGMAPPTGSAITLNVLEDMYDWIIWSPTAPSADGYRFTGWYDAASGGDLVEFPLAIHADTTFYAHWATPEVTAPATAGAGHSISVDGTGFEPGESVNIELHSDPVHLTTVIADVAGEIHVSVTLPAGTPAGSHTLVLTGSATGVTTKPITLNGALAFTGLNTAPLALTGLGLSACGAGLIVASLFVRRRSSR